MEGVQELRCMHDTRTLTHTNIYLRLQEHLRTVKRAQTPIHA